MGTNLKRICEEESLSKEDIQELICIEHENKPFEQRRDGYPFVENLKKSFMTSHINGCSTQDLNPIKQYQILEKRFSYMLNHIEK